MLIPAVANGVANAARTPVMLKSSGPRTANIDQGASAFTPGGRAATSHTADNSAGVRVTEKNSPCMTQGGSGSPCAHRQIAYEPGTRSSVRLATISQSRGATEAAASAEVMTGTTSKSTRSAH